MIIIYFIRLFNNTGSTSVNSVLTNIKHLHVVHPIQDLLHFDGSGRHVNVGEFEAFVLIAGMFIGRAIVTTVRQNIHSMGKKLLYVYIHI